MCVERFYSVLARIFFIERESEACSSHREIYYAAYWSLILHILYTKIMNKIITVIQSSLDSESVVLHSLP